MGQSKNDFMQERAAQEGKKLETVFTLPEVQMDATEIKPGLLKLSKANVEEFHLRMKSLIFDSGNGMFEYLGIVKFFTKLNAQIFGDSQAGIAEDRELLDYARGEVAKYGKNGYTAPNSVKYVNQETGTKYNFEQCNDQVLVELYSELVDIKTRIKEREDFLKAIPAKGTDILDPDTGEVTTLYPPAKSSKSSIVITLPKK
jgi:hypothetical protein